MRAKKLEVKYCIKNTDTEEYLSNYIAERDAKGYYITSINPKTHNHSFQYKIEYSKNKPKFFNSYGGAVKTLSMALNKSFKSYDKMNKAEKVLFSDGSLSKYKIVRVELSFKELPEENQQVTQVLDK